MKKEKNNQSEEEIVFEDEVENLESDFKGKIKKLKLALRACEKEKQEYLDGWQRAKADFVNARKRDEESNKRVVEYAQADLIEEILPVLDSFEMAFSQKDVWESVDSNWRKGIESIYSQLSGILKNHGVEVLNPLEEEFDPTFFEAVEIVSVDDEKRDHRVVEVVQKGYKIKDRVLRTAKVKVGKV